jgi:hypothetical protein|mmetsp:Transcript_32424/g.52711  ORF Transcript_32424/g.52711 Transcript_32424/m.52711 type:complete len:100 (-) Transcript_32424:144-443(-)
MVWLESGWEEGDIACAATTRTFMFVAVTHHFLEGWDSVMIWVRNTPCIAGMHSKGVQGGLLFINHLSAIVLALLSSTLSDGTVMCIVCHLLACCIFHVL